MRQLGLIAVFALLMAALPLLTQSGVWLNFATMTLYAALLAQAWNILGGYGGQFSFGHALFFGVGAYMQAIAQLQWGVNPWVALVLAGGVGALVGCVIGWISFRYGLRGSYFALITLAFSEVFRILALSVPFTGAGVGLMIPLRESAANLQFGSRAGFLYLVLAFVVLALLVSLWLQHSRFGAYLQAVRDNEDAARAVGVDPLRVKLGAISLSGLFMGFAGAFYVQVFQYIDPSLAFGLHVSVQALTAPIVGGLGTLWGPLLGAFTLSAMAELTRNLFGELPGINMVIYGCVLVLIVMFAPRGIAGMGRDAVQLWRGRRG